MTATNIAFAIVMVAVIAAAVRLWTRDTEWKDDE